MGMTLACRDSGIDCDYVTRGETVEEIMQDIAKHAKNVHGYTDEQLKDPELLEKIKSLIKTE